MPRTFPLSSSAALIRGTAGVGSGPAPASAVSVEQCRRSQAEFYHRSKESFHGDDGKAVVLGLLGRRFPSPCGQAGHRAAVIDVGVGKGRKREVGEAGTTEPISIGMCIFFSEGNS